ncbi:hypothetical protein M569_01782, partial [Genlisea aurea]
MYDLPPKFHFGMLGWEAKNDSVWPDLSEIPPYPGGLNLQHSVEYWLTLDLLLLLPSRPSASVIRVENSSDADVVFVPFFSSLSYNRGSKGGEGQSWRQVAAGGVGEVFGGWYPAEVANADKDVIAPYKPHGEVGRRWPFLAVRSQADLGLLPRSHTPERCKGGAIRGKLYRLMKNQRDVEFSSGIRAAGRGMSSSKFCLHIAGDTPVVEPPDVIDYSEFCVFIGAEDAVRKEGYVVDRLRSVGRDEWDGMREKLRNVSRYFEYRFPSRKKTDQ